MYLALCPQGPVPSREAKRVAELIWSPCNALLETITIEREKEEQGTRRPQVLVSRIYTHPDSLGAKPCDRGILPIMSGARTCHGQHAQWTQCGRAGVFP